MITLVQRIYRSCEENEMRGAGAMESYAVFHYCPCCIISRRLLLVVLVRKKRPRSRPVVVFVRLLGHQYFAKGQDVPCRYCGQSAVEQDNTGNR